MYPLVVEALAYEGNTISNLIQGSFLAFSSYIDGWLNYCVVYFLLLETGSTCLVV
jgi:hypothetical protein